MAKVTYPGRKQVFRATTRGQYAGDRIALEGEPANGGDPLLAEVMRAGRRTRPPEPVDALRRRCMESLAQLPERIRQIHRPAVYPVRYSKRLMTLLEKVRRRIRRTALK